MHMDDNRVFWVIKNTIRDGGSPAQYAAYTVDTVDTVVMVYTVDMVYTDTIETVYNIQTALHCLNSLKYAYIYC